LSYPGHIILSKIWYH